MAGSGHMAGCARSFKVNLSNTAFSNERVFNLSKTDRPDRIITGVEARVEELLCVHRIFSSIPGLHPPDTHCDNQTCLQTLLFAPIGQNPTPWHRHMARLPTS